MHRLNIKPQITRVGKYFTNYHQLSQKFTKLFLFSELASSINIFKTTFVSWIKECLLCKINIGLKNKISSFWKWIAEFKILVKFSVYKLSNDFFNFGYIYAVYINNVNWTISIKIFQLYKLSMVELIKFITCYHICILCKWNTFEGKYVLISYLDFPMVTPTFRNGVSHQS